MTERQVPEQVSNPEIRPTINVERIERLCNQLIRQRISVAEAEIDLADAKVKIEETKARVIGEGYANDTIDGSNKQTRDAQENQLLAESEALAQAQMLAREAELASAEAKAQLAGTEERISLYRAFLYSTARMPR